VIATFPKTKGLNGWLEHWDIIPHYIHIDLVGRVSAHHVQDRELPAWVPVDPFAEMQGVALVNHDRVALRNLARYFLWGKYCVSRHSGC
jgi:hypothetical protein